tara:strand:+ start:248 stop:457 length:210 start_codon:yes stop_codon:yes gene_type:complete
MKIFEKITLIVTSESHPSYTPYDHLADIISNDPELDLVGIVKIRAMELLDVPDGLKENPSAKTKETKET